MSRLRLIIATTVLTVAAPASAVTIGSDEVNPLEIHGFASQGWIKTWDNNYLAESRAERGSFEFSEVGVNVTKQFGDKLRMGTQLFARKLGPLGNYNAKMDWFYIDYRFRDWLGLRAGRVKMPFGLYNEINDVDAARAQVLLPQSVYPAANRDFLLAQSGGELYGLIPLAIFGNLEYRLYAGVIQIDTPANEPGAPVRIDRLRVPYVMGGRLMWETPLEGLRVGGSLQDLRLDTTATFGGVETVNVEIPAVLWVASAEYTYENLLLAAEYSRWHVQSQNSSNPAIFPDDQETTSERAYVMGTYRITDWLQPGAYYSLLFPNTREREGRANIQNDIAATFRFDITENWLVKLEGHYMLGTADLSTALNDGKPRSELKKEWGLVLVKTTAYF
ncbi:MAG: hypothetical protein ACAI38_15075 [Myxococcota bacterium]